MNEPHDCVGCTAQLDMAAQLSGEREQPGWHTVCTGVICPDCWATGHHPQYSLSEGGRDAIALCVCGWRGEQVLYTLADVGHAWRRHLDETRQTTDR